MVRETRYLIVRNLPENCTEQTVIDHFQRYGKIQSVKLQTAKDNDTDSTATVAFNDIKSAAKAHHAKNCIGEVTLRTDYWEGSTATPVLASTPVVGNSTVRSAVYTSATPASSRLASTFSSWTKGPSDEDGSSTHDKGDSSQPPPPGTTTPITASPALDKLSSTAFDLQRGRGRDRIKQKKFGQKFEKCGGSFGRHGTTTSTRSLEAARSQSEAAAAAAAAVASSSAATSSQAAASTSGTSISNGGTAGLNPIIVSDTKEVRELKEGNRESSSRSRPHSVASPSSRNSGIKKSNSHSRSVSRSRSRSRGSRSSSSRSHSSGTSQSTSPHRSHASSTARPQSMVGSSRLVSSEVKEAKRDDNDERRPLGICVMGLPTRSTDSSLRDGLYHEYKKQGKVTTVQICGDGENRCAIISFRKPEDAIKALEASQGKTFFGSQIKVVSHEGVEVDDADRGNDIDSLDEYHVKSTRTLFVGNLEKETTQQDLIDKFQQYGEIIDVDIKRQGATTAFAFVQYADIVSVVSALRAMEGEHIGINKIKLGFGKSMPTDCVWLDCLPSSTSNRTLRSTLGRYGEVIYCYIDRHRNKGLVYFSSYEDAQRCVSDIKARPHVMKKKLQIDFASRECQNDFFNRMERTNQLRANERPDDSNRVHRFRQQRSFDGFQDDGSPSAYGFSRASSSFSARNGRSSSGSTSFRRGRQYADATFPEENHSSSTRRSRRQEEYGQSGQFYNSKGSTDDYDAVLREYGHSQRERRERDLSPRHSADRHGDSQSRQSSRDHSLDRYEKERTVEIYNSRDTSPGSDHNSFHSESRYRSSRDEKYPTRDRYDDAKVEEKDFDHHSRVSRNASPFVHNHSSSHDSDYEHRGGSRSQSPPTPIQEDSSIHRIYYNDEYKRSVEVVDDCSSYSHSQKQKDSDDVTLKSKLVSFHPSKLGAEVLKTASKSRKRIHDESALSDVSKLDGKLLRKSEKISMLLTEKGKSSDKEKKHHEASRHVSKVHDLTTGSPGSSGSHVDSENGSVSEGDLHHLHQEKHHILRKLQELNEEGIGTSEPDSPRSVYKIKSVAVKEALRLSGRSHDDRKYDEAGSKSDTHRRQGAKARGVESRRESRSHLTEEMNSTREDKNLIDEKEESVGGNSDLDYSSDFRRMKKRRTESSVDIASVKGKGYRRPSSVDISDEENLDQKSDHGFRMLSGSVVSRVSCDSRVGSKSYGDPSKTVEVSSCDSSDVFKGGLSDKDISVIKQSQTVSKSNTFFPNKDWNVDYGGTVRSPVGCFSPACSDDPTQDSVTSGSLTEKSSEHPPSPPWQHTPTLPLIGKDISYGEYGYFKDFTIPSNLSPDDCLSDDSLEGDLLPAPGEPSVEERIRVIDEMLNMTVSSKSADPSLLVSVLSNKDIANNNDNTALYSKFRIRKREGGLDGGNGSLLTDKKPEPSVIMQQVLSKKSILDQDFKRLEQMCEKYDLSSGREVVKTEVLSPKLVELKGDSFFKPLLSPSLLSPSLSHPVTTSSSMLQPTITTSVAGSTSSFSVTSFSVLTTPVVTTPITTCSIYTLPKLAALDASRRLKVKTSEASLEIPDRHSICTNVLTLKQDIVVSSSSSPPPSVSHPVLTFTNNSLTSSVSQSVTISLPGTLLPETTTTQQSCKFAVSPSSLPPSLLSASASSASTSSASTSCLPSTVHSRTTLQHSVLISPYISSLSSSSSLSVSQSTSGAPVAAPFTQGPDKALLTPIVGQEAPRLCSPSFTPENSRTPGTSHMPGSTSPRVASHTTDSDQLQKTNGKTDLKVIVSIDGDSKTDELKANTGISPDIESPVSVQSESSSIASVPLSSIDSKTHLHLDEKTLTIPPVNISQSTGSLHTSDVNFSVKSSDSAKTELVSPVLDMEKTVMEMCEKNQQSMQENVVLFETTKAADILVSKEIKLSSPFTSQTVLSVSSKDHSEKQQSVMDTTCSSSSSNSGKGKLSSSLTLHTTNDIDPTSALKALTSSSAATSSVTSHPVSKSSFDKNDKKVSGKLSSNSSKMSSGAVKSEALFAPDVKMEQIVKASDSRSDSRHQPAKGSASKSSSSDRKSAKSTPKDSHENKDLQSKESEKTDKRLDAEHKNSSVHESSKSRDIHKGKDKRDQSKDSDKSRPKDKEDKKKEEKKTSEKKSEKKLVATKDDKKVEKKVDDRKDKNSEKAKSGQAKHSKSESSGSKQEKKQKEKVKDVKDKSGDKKVTAGLSAKHPATVEVRPDSKSVQKTDSKEATSAKHGTVKDSSIKSEKEGTQKSEAIGKSELKTKHKSEAKVAGKGLGEAKSDSKESLTAAKKPAQVSKSKKEQDKGGSKQNLSKQGHKFLKLKQSDDDKLKEKQKTKEEKDRQKDKEREEKELKEQEEKEKQKEKEEERTEREEREIEEKLKEERERQKEIEREEKEREMKEKEEKEQKEKERQERERQKEKEREEKEKQKEKEREEKEKQKEKEKEERERQKEKDREEKERQKEEKLRQKEREKEEKERQKEREREEKERQKEKEREEKERQKEREREEKERQKEKEKEEKERQRKEREEKERQKEEREEKERQKEKEREEKERQKKEREEKERQKEKEREEKERQKEKEREQKERQKEKEDKERREREEKDKLRKEKEEKDKQKQKEKDEKEIPKEKKTDKKMKIKEEKPKEKAKKEKAKADIKADKKGKEKKAKEEKPKKDKEDKLKKEKDEKNKKDKEEKEKANRDKEKAEKERKEKEEKEKKKAAPKKPKRNELAALLEHNDMIQMSFTSMYDRVKTQRNREPDPQHKSEPAPKSSFDKFKQNRKKSGSKVKSSFYTFDTSSGASEGDDLDELSDLSDQDSTLKNDSVSETKPKKSKQVKKRAHVSSSSSSCEEDDDALLSASKPKSQKADKYNAIFSSDSDDDNFQPPSKFKASVNGKFKPVAKRRKTREGSSDSMASRDEFLKPHNLSSITDSLDDMDVSEEDEIKSKRKKTKAKPILSSDHDDRDSSMESVTRKTAKTDLDSSLESVTKTPMKVDKEESPPKKTKPESKKVTKTHDSKVNVKERPKLANDKKKGKNETEKGYNKMEISSKTETVKQKSKVQSEGKLVEKSKVKPEAEKPRPKVKAATKTNVEKPKHKVEAEVTNVEKPKHKVEAEVTNVEKPKHKVEAEVTAEPEKSKLKEDKPREEDKLTTNEPESKSTADKASVSESKSTADKVSVSESKSTADKVSIVSESKSIADKINIVSESKSTADKVSVVVSESKSTADKVSVVSESKSTADKVSVVVSESKSTADKLSVISENKSAADKLIVLPENKSAADKLSVLSESKSASDKVSVISESKSAADKVSIVSESKSTADKVSVDSESKSAADKVSVVSESKSAADKLSVVSESKSTADKVSVVSESKSAADKLSVVSESKTAADKLSVVSESTLPVGETKNQQAIEAKTDTEKPRSKSEEKQKVKLEVESRSHKEKSIVKIESDNKTETEVLTMEVENLSDTETAKSKVEVGNKSVDKVMQSKPELQIKPDEERPVSFMEVEVKSDDDSLREGRIEPEEKPDDEKSSSKSLSSNDAKSKFPAERKKKNEDKEDSVVKKKKKKKYDPLKEEELVDSLITKVYDKLEREKKEKKKSKLANFDSEAEDSSAQSEASSKTVSSHTEKVSAKTEEIEPAKPKEEKMDIPKESARLEKHADAKPVAEEVSKVAKKKNRKKKDKKDQKESVDEIDVVMKDQPEKKNKEKPDMEMKQEKMVKSEDRSDDEHLKPPRKKKKKDHDRDADREKEKGVKVGRSPDQKSDTEKSLSVGSEDNMSDDKSSSQFVDEFTSFWGHPKPILIPKRLKDSKKSDDDKVKHKDHKDDLKAGGTDSSDAPSNKDDSRDGSEAKLSPTGDKALETLQNAGQMSDSATEADKTLKMELEMIDDLIVPISEAETTVITEVTSVGTIDSVSSIGASLHMHEESFLEVPAAIPDETTIGSSVEIDDDDFPSLIIDEVPESSEKKVTRKDKKLLKKQQVKVLNDHMDEVIASVAMALSSDDEDQTSLHIDSISNDRELLLSDVINQELKYTSKISREPESKSAIITDMLFVDKDVKSKQSGMSSHGSTQKDKDTSGGAKKEQERKKDLKIFGQLDEETKKRDEELLKTLAVLCDPNLDRPVVIDDSKREPSPEAIKKKEEADKKKAEEERIKLEEEKKKAEEEERKKAEEEKKKAEEEKRKKAEEEKRKAEEEAKKAAEEREKAEAERKKAEEEEERRKIEEEKKRIEEEKQRAEEEKKRAEEEKKRAEEEEKRKAEEEKTRREKEEQALREASDEAARAVESLLEFQSGYDQEPVDVDDDLPPLFIEPADKEPPVETVTMSPSGDKNDLVSIFSSPIPDKVTANLDDKLLTANLDDKLLEKKLDEKGPMDQTDNKLDSFSLFATPAQTVTPASVLTSPRRNSAGIKEKTPEPVTSPHRQIQPSPQMHTPHRMQFPPQRPLQSPQGQMQSPQGQMQSPQSQMQSPQSQMQSPQSQMQSPQSHMQSPQSHMQSPQKSAMSPQMDVHSPQPVLHPQRSPFFGKDTAKTDRNFVLANTDASSHSHVDIPHGQQPQRRVSTTLSAQPILDQPLRPIKVSPRRKSQEILPEQLAVSSRRNTIATPEDVSVTHLDRRFPSYMGTDIIFSKERTHSISSLPPPVSISLDHAPHDTNSQSPMQSLNIPSHQDNILLSPKKASPVLQFKERTPDPPVFSSGPSKSALQEPASHFPKGIIQEQIFAQFPKCPSQEPLFYGAKSQASELFRPNKVAGDNVLLHAKSPAPEKPVLQPNRAPDALLMQQKIAGPELVLQHTKGPHHVLDPFPQLEKGVLPPREQMFSPKSQPDNPFSYTDQNIDFLLNSPPRNNLTFPSFPHTTEVNLPPVTKQPDFSQDPLFIAATEAGSRPGDRDPSHIRRTEGFPASFYQEPVPGPKTHQDKVTISLQQHQAAIEDDKKGSRKRKRNNKKATNEDRAAALAELQAIEESVQANVDSIRKALNANQAKAAAEKAHMVGADKKKMLDAYDFEAHIGQDLAGTPGTLTSDGGYSSFGETETKPLRSRNERGRGRGNGTRRGRRGRGAVSSVHEPPDSHQRPDTFSPSQPPLNLPIHAQNPDSLQPQMQQQHPLQQFGLSQQQLPPFQRQTQQGQGNHQPSHAFSQSHPSPVSSENSSSLPGPDWQQKQVSQPYSHSHMAPAQQQMQQQQQLPPVRLPAPKSDVLSSESNKHDLDLSYGESELIINLDDQPSSTEGKENQYSLSSDGEERSLIPSPSAPKSQRSTRARKQPDYKAIASGNIHPPAQLRSSRSGGSPRGLGNGANSPRSMSPRTRSTESMSSSPVVKLEKLEVGRTTRSRRGEIASKGHVKDNDSERVPPSTAVFEEPKARADVEENKSVSKENIYEFVDNEHEQVIETSLRSARARKKRVSDQEFPLQQQQQQQPLPDYMPASPVSGSNSASFGQESRHGFEGHVPEERSTGESPKLPHLSNVDAIIDAVAKGNFGSFDDDPPAPASAPATPAAAPATPAAAPATPAAAPEPDHVPAPPTTRLTRRSTELKKEAEQKAEKTFIIAEPPRFEGREAGRKGPTVPPLRIKVAHGAKVEKSEEKHYVIERAKGPGSTTESEKPPLAFTVKLSDTGTAIIKSAVGTSTTSLASPQLSVPSGKHPLATAGDAFKTDNLQKKDSSIGLFSGLPQNDQHSNEVDTKPSVAVSQAPPWKSMDALADEATVSRPTGALHPKVAAKVQASQESQINIVQAQTSLPQVVQQYPPSSTASLSGLSKSSPVTPATPHGIKHTWSSSLQQDSHHQLVIPEQASAGSYLPSAYHQNLPQMSSPLPRDAQIMQQQQPPPASHPEAKLPPNAHSQPVLRSERPGKTGKAGGMDMNPDLPSKLTAETQKHQQSPFTFPPHLPPAHSGQRQFIMPSEQSGHHTPHFPGGSLLKSGSDNRPAKSPSIQSQVASKIGPEVRTQTPPVTPGAMLYAGVVSGQPHSLSPSAASPEGQVIERIQNPIRQPESSQSQSPLSLHLPGSHHPEAVNRFLKDENPEGSGPLGGHAERTPSREIAMYQQILEHQRLQQHLMIAEAARNSDPARNIAAAMRNVIESSRNTPAALEGGRKGSLPTSQAVGHGQPLNLTPQSDLRAGQPDPSRVTPKSTPPAPQSPFSMQYYDRKGESGRLPATVAGSFMQPSPGGHRTDGLAPHLYPELSLANLPHSSYMVGRLPIDPRIYASGQQPPPHLMREGVLSGSFPQAFPPGSRFPGLEHPEGKKNESGHPEQPGPHMLRSPSPIQRQMQADALRQQLTRMPCDLPTRDSPVGFLQRYPVMWQGALALKNDNSYVQMHFIAGNRRLPNQALPQPMQNGALPPLRISQRMRLEHAQLEGVTKRMQCEDHYCILIAVACGRDQIDINQQTRALNEGFITYLLSKQAAGIVNVPLPGSEQVRFVVHIFPPCEFVDNSVAQQGSVVLMEQLREVPHAVVIIATT